MNVNVDLTEHIKMQIEATGPITIAEFMSICLNGIQNSYYVSSSPIGRSGDFITAPEISQLFGEMIGIWCGNFWQLSGKPKDFNLIELGPGRGTLLKDVLRVAQNIDGMLQSINLHLVEISPILRKIQAEAISHPKVKWHESFESLEDKFSIIIANEFFDALPINQYVKKDKWYVNVVDLNEDKRHLCIKHDSVNANMREFLSKNYSHVPEDGVLEINDQGHMLVKQIVNKIKKSGGAALIIDYGYVEHQARSFISTLQSVKNHQYNPIFKDIGNSDLSSHVNFSALVDIVKIHGGFAHGPITQSEFLRNMHIDVRKNQLLQNAKTDAIRQDINSGYNRLMDPTQMGNLFKAIAITHTAQCDIGFKTHG